ncbi:HNH endonuclease [Cohnella massiliensis]|uniref:HNH endonuclease n=1 Tax=Cohnella massiliensis TaxID=1816691 RepID=UPI0009B9C535|nr:HNH endonuclease [Cohnella massiliensis]
MIKVSENGNPNSRPIPKIVKDFDGVEVILTINEKLIACWTMYQNLQHLYGAVFHTTFERLSFLIDMTNGGVYRYNNKKFELFRDGSTLYLQRKKGRREWKVVYEDEVFSISRGNWLMESCQRSGSNNSYKVFTIRKGIIIRDHQLIVLFRDGSVGLLGIGENRHYEVNHFDRNTYNNSPNNLVLGTKKENQEHRIENLDILSIIKLPNGELGFNF